MIYFINKFNGILIIKSKAKLSPFDISDANFRWINDNYRIDDILGPETKFLNKNCTYFNDLEISMLFGLNLFLNKDNLILIGKSTDPK